MQPGQGPDGRRDSQAGKGSMVIEMGKIDLNKKKFPVGIEFFGEFMTEDFYYVDKGGSGL